MYWFPSEKSLLPELLRESGIGIDRGEKEGKRNETRTKRNGQKIREDQNVERGWMNRGVKGE